MASSQGTPAPLNPRQMTLLYQIGWFFGYARKAFVAFMVGGGGAALAQGIATLDFTNLTLANLWTGIGVGMLSALVVYWTSNKEEIVSDVREGLASEPPG